MYPVYKEEARICFPQHHTYLCQVHQWLKILNHTKSIGAQLEHFQGRSQVRKVTDFGNFVLNQKKLLKTGKTKKPGREADLIKWNIKFFEMVQARKGVRGKWSEQIFIQVNVNDGVFQSLKAVKNFVCNSIMSKT